MIYEDNLIAIDESCLIVKKYYFPLFSAKTIKLDQIQKAEFWPASIWHARFRIMGFRDYETWFAWDSVRPFREGVFVLTLDNSWFRVGFSSENCEKVKQIFLEKGLLKNL